MTGLHTGNKLVRRRRPTLEWAATLRLARAMAAPAMVEMETERRQGGRWHGHWHGLGETAVHHDYPSSGSWKWNHKESIMSPVIAESKSCTELLPLQMEQHLHSLTLLSGLFSWSKIDKILMWTLMHKGRVWEFSGEIGGMERVQATPDKWVSKVKSNTFQANIDITR